MNAAAAAVSSEVDGILAFLCGRHVSAFFPNWLFAGVNLNSARYNTPLTLPLAPKRSLELGGKKFDGLS